MCGVYYLSQQFFGPDAMSHDANKETEAEVVCLRSHSRLAVTELKSRSFEMPPPCDIAQLLRLSLWPPWPNHQAVSITSQFYLPHLALCKRCRAWGSTDTVSKEPRRQVTEGVL